MSMMCFCILCYISVVLWYYFYTLAFDSALIHWSAFSGIGRESFLTADDLHVSMTFIQASNSVTQLLWVFGCFSA